MAKGQAMQELEVSGYSSAKEDSGSTQISLIFTLYNPIRGQPINWSEHESKMKEIDKHILILPTLQQHEQNANNMVVPKLGKFQKGSIISYQQKLDDDFAMNVYDSVPHLDLPAADVMQTLVNCPLNLKQSTESSMAQNQKEIDSQHPALHYKRQKGPSIATTKAMRHGLESEPAAA